MRDDDRLAEELVLLVDGRLDPERAGALEELARADAGLAARIALVRSGRDHVRTAADSVEAPFELRRRVGDLADARPARGARAGAVRWPRWQALAPWRPWCSRWC